MVVTRLHMFVFGPLRGPRPRLHMDMCTRRPLRLLSGCLSCPMRDCTGDVVNSVVVSELAKLATHREPPASEKREPRSVPGRFRGARVQTCGELCELGRHSSRLAWRRPLLGDPFAFGRGHSEDGSIGQVTGLHARQLLHVRPRSNAALGGNDEDAHEPEKSEFTRGCDSR